MPHTYTWDKLAKNSIRLNPNSRGPNYPTTPRFELLMVIPYIGTKSVLVKLQAWGVTQNNLHQVTLLFQDCEILTGEQNLSLIEYFKVDYQNETYWVKKFDKLKNPMSNRCTCADYFFNAAWYNYYNGNCLYGPAPKPYQKKTNRPRRNQLGIPIICKHIYNAWSFLKQQGFTKN